MQLVHIRLKEKDTLIKCCLQLIESILMCDLELLAQCCFIFEAEQVVREALGGNIYKAAVANNIVYCMHFILKQENLLG